MKKMLTRKEVATMLQVSERTVDRMRKNGLPYTQIGQLIRFKEQDVIDYISKEK